jgi:hypothetical protein
MTWRALSSRLRVHIDHLETKIDKGLSQSEIAR